MKLSTLMLAGLMGLTSVAALAEGGSERSKEFYNNFSFIQEQTHGTTEQTASTDAKSKKTGATEQSTDAQQPNS
ncbi:MULTISPECIES: hypothetical protein [unclassified Pseudomonas]|uniref:hypothetical protein n=1 Tax=unclassified Pseudomonas TaxID=196821 RepID=UPI0011EBAE17|nr:MULTISPECIES: hypothetical protein [unclassified Pseudomonas]KAA0942526.1 hypothetical protein FQ182_27215 [Pseudomonas sp. ANT_H4]KAA0948014.1 hypothetical protein FQ186_23945 [Pseudomonas sp. ANT_H14]